MTITEADVLDRVRIIADDSMMGRDTPSRGLELTASYVAAEFRRMGLRPAGDSGGYIQRFGVTRWTVDTGRSGIALAAGSARNKTRLGGDARYVLGRLPDGPIRGPVFLIAGPAASSGAAAPEAKGRIVLRVADFSQPAPPALDQELLALSQAGAEAVLVLSNRDSSAFADRLRASARPRLTRDSEAEDSSAPVVEIHERGLGPVLRAAGIDVANLRRVQREERRLVPGLTIEVDLARRVLAQALVPNVVGLLEGRDSRLRREYLVYSAHLDHLGISSGQAEDRKSVV